MQTRCSFCPKNHRTAGTTHFEAGTSTIPASLNIPYGVLAAAANGAADRFSGPRQGHAQIGCSQATLASTNSSLKINVPHGCVDFVWHVNAARNGKITAKRDGAEIAVAVPVKFTGNGGFDGDLAKAVRMNSKDFSGTFVVSISGVVRLDKDFCPKLEQPATHFAWGTAPEIGVVERSCIDAGGGLKACIGPWKFPVGAMLTDQINRSLADQVGEVNRKIPCDQVRQQLTQVWKNWSFPVSLENSPPFFVNLEPKSLSIPGVTANDASINVEARLEATSGITAARPPGKPVPPLPENTPLASGAGKFSLNVPLAIPYPALAAAAAGNFIGKPLRAGTGAAKSITPTAIEFFPSNDKLAVGVTFRADGPGKLRGRTGIVWFTAVPTVDNDGRRIRIGGFALTRKNDGNLWALSAAFGMALPQAIAKAWSYDLAPAVNDARTKLDRAIADPKNTGNVKIGVADGDLRLGRTALLPDAFAVEGNFNADVTATLEAAPPL